MAISTNAVRESLAIGKAITGHHWRVWEWCNGRLEQFLSGRPAHRPQSLQHLWQLMQSGQIIEGDYIDFRSDSASGTFWHIQEWVPRAPGRLWQQDNLFDTTPDELASVLAGPQQMPRHLIDRFWSYSAHAHWEGQFIDSTIRGRSLQGQGFDYRFGCYRPAIGTHPDQYALLGVTTAKESLVDLAFPVVLSEPAYLKIVRTRYSDHASVEFEGRVRVGPIQRSEGFSGYIGSVGSQQNDALKAIIDAPVHVSPFVGHLVSPIDIDCRINDSHPFVSIRVDGWNIDPETLDRGVVMICRTVVINPADKLVDRLAEGDPVRADQLRFDTSFLLGQDHQFGTEMQPITDFDGRIQRFQSQLWVGANPASDQTILEKVRSPAITDNEVENCKVDRPDESWLL